MKETTSQPNELIIWQQNLALKIDGITITIGPILNDGLIDELNKVAETYNIIQKLGIDPAQLGQLLDGLDCMIVFYQANKYNDPDLWESELDESFCSIEKSLNLLTP